MSKIVYLQLAIIIAFGVLTGCIKETGCDHPGVQIMVNVATAGQEKEIEKVMLYVFGNDNILLDTIPTNLGDIVTLDYPQAGTLRVVALCNAFPDAVGVSPLTLNSSNFSDAFVSLKSLSMTKAPMNIYKSPSDIFWGSKEVDLSQPNQSLLIPVARQVASMNITVRELTQGSSQYELVVGTTKNKMDFTNRLFGEDAGYLPMASFAPNKDFVTPTFTLFPSLDDEFLSIRLLRNGVEVLEVTSNGNGVPLQAFADQTLNVFIEVSSTIVDVGIKVTGWGEVYKWNKVFP